jgi:holin-like protein
LKLILGWGRGFGILVGLYLLGEFLSQGLSLSIPGSLVGMLLLLPLLFSGVLKLEWVEKVADGLLRHLILLFVPSAVGIMIYAKNISGMTVEIVLTALLSTLVVLVITGKTVDWIINWQQQAGRTRRQQQ